MGCMGKDMSTPWTIVLRKFPQTPLHWDQPMATHIHALYWTAIQLKLQVSSRQGDFAST